MQQLLWMTTETHSPRSQVFGWSAEDPRLVEQGKPIGFTPGVKFFHTYETVMHALADGWRLLGPPSQAAKQEWIWWLVRDVS